VSSEENVRAEIYVSGRVQGVGFRRFARNSGKRLGVDCNPVNLMDGRVFVVAEGRREALELLINDLRKGPTYAHVEDVNVTFKTASGSVYEFSFRS
jgi:acylphosphatase